VITYRKIYYANGGGEKSDMIEVVYKEDAKKIQEEQPGTIKLPKNVTQIGTGPGNRNLKIYVENDTLEHIKETEPGVMHYGVFLGKRERDDGEYIFVKNYVSIGSNKENIILFNDDVWLGVYDEIKKNGYEGDIIGWYVVYPENRHKNLGQLKKLHLDNFAGINKVMFCMEQENQEDGFYIYNNNIMEKQSVYYLYWGKSVITKQHPVGNVEKDKAVVNKSSNKETSGKMPWGSVAMIAVLIGVLAFMGNSGMLSGVIDRASALIQQGTGTENPSSNQVNAENKTTENRQTSENEQNTTDGQINDEEQSTTAKEVNNEEQTTTSGQTDEEKTTTENKPDGEEQTTTAGSVSGEISGTVYTVLPGETLYDICRKYYGTLEKVEEIITANGIENPDKIYSGQKLILP